MADAKPRHFEYILVLTAFAAGAVDVMSFTGLGGVFASAMTGNLAFLALYTAKGSIYSAIGSLVALVGFVIGAACGTLLTRGQATQPAVTILLVTETLTLGIAAISWLYLSHRTGGWLVDGAILILAGAMGLQGVTGKKINLSNIPTIVFTSTLTNIVIAVTDVLASGSFTLSSDTKRQSVSFLLYFAGAAAAGLMILCGLGNIILLPFAAVAVACAIHGLQPRRRTDPAKL